MYLTLLIQADPGEVQQAWPLGFGLQQPRGQPRHLPPPAQRQHRQDQDGSLPRHPQPSRTYIRVRQKTIPYSLSLSISNISIYINQSMLFLNSF